MNKVYSVVTDQIVKIIEGGVVPWRKPWASHMPMNLISKREYRGINRFLLGCTGHAAPWWVTFRQAKGLGGNIKKGEKGSVVVFWKMGDEEVDKETGKKRRAFILRYYKVFNLDQCENIDAGKVPELPGTAHEHEPIGDCEDVVRWMPKAPPIKSASHAFYSPKEDCVGMPLLSAFEKPEAYYSTLFHELTHSTGHASRVDRQFGAKVAGFGSKDYSKEELVAEMGAAFLCGVTGIETATIENSAAYVAGWLKALRDDVTLVVKAAGQAQAAVDFILGIKKGEV